MFVRRWISSLATLVVVAVPLAACSGGSSGNKSLSVTYADVADATRTAGPARLDGTVGTSGPGSMRGNVEGDLSGTGQVVANLVTDSTGTVELRWRDKTLYVRRVAVKAVPTFGSIDSWTMRAVTDRPWSKRPISSQFTPNLLAPFSPAELAHRLDISHVPFDVTRDGSRRKLHMTKGVMLLGAWPQSTADLWIDGHDRVVRVEISSLGRVVLAYDVTYGGPRPDPQVPPATEIVQPTSSAPAPKGAFVTRKSGTTNGVTWSVQRAPATQGDECWRFVAHPTVKIVGVDANGNRCIAPVSESTDPADQAEFVASTDGRGSYDVLVVRLPRNARTIMLTPTSGAPISSDASGDVFVWLGPTTPKVGFAVITLADGTRLTCGPGNINSAAELHQTGADTQMSFPWACTAP